MSTNDSLLYDASNTIAIKKERNSNLELLRIVAMLIIIAHHYVVNSTVTQLYDYANITGNMVFLQLMGFGGKMAINVFVLISAYFMCTQRVTWKRVLKLVAMVYFYIIVIFPIFLATGYEDITLRRIFMLAFGSFYSIGREFVGSFLVFYLIVPFLNLFTKQLNRKQHFYLMFFLVFVFSVVYTFLFASDACRYVGWYVTLYFVASYIRLYPNKYFENRRFALWSTIISLVLTWLSILTIDFVGTKFDFTYVYYMCADSQKILALLLSLSLFCLFKNLNIKQNKLINTFAASAFGVFLIHANSNAMRTWLWQDFLKVPEQYNSPMLPLHLASSVLGIYLVCAGIDYLRIKIIEEPVFLKLDKISFLQKECFID